MSLEDIRLVERTGSADNERDQLNRTITAIKELIPASGDTVTSSKIGNWDLAFSWGDHGEEGYLIPGANAVISGNWNFSNGLASNGNPVVEATSGSWTPVIAGSTTAGSHTYGTQTGTWVKHGNLVFVAGDVQITTYDGTMAGDLRITGLPETAEPDTSGVSFGLVSFGGSASPPADFLQLFGNVVNNVLILRYTKSGGGEGAYPVANTANFMRLRFSATYQVA